MRLETIAAWIFIGFALLMIGALLHMSQVPEVSKLAQFLGVVGVIYFAIGVVLTVIHDQHMAERTRAGRE